MANPDAQRWNERYHREREFWLHRQPRQLLMTFEHLLPHEGRALDAASGMGVNAIFLAKLGIKVFAFDISEYALIQAKKRSKSEDKPIHTVVYDLSNPWFPANYFDVIINFHFLERAAISIFKQALIPGGLIFFDTYVRHQGQDSPNYYLAPGELRHYFQEFEIIHYAEDEIEKTENHAERGIAQLVARKPF